MPPPLMLITHYLYYYDMPLIRLLVYDIEEIWRYAMKEEYYTDTRQYYCCY